MLPNLDLKKMLEMILIERAFEKHVFKKTDTCNTDKKNWWCLYVWHCTYFSGIIPPHNSFSSVSDLLGAVTESFYSSFLQLLVSKAGSTRYVCK